MITGARFLKSIIAVAAAIFTVSMFCADVHSSRLSNNSYSEAMSILLIDTYDEYMQKRGNKKYANNQVEIYTNYVDKYLGDIEIKKGIGGYNEECVVTGERSFAEWHFDVEEEGFYSIEIEYYPLAGRGINIERILQIDGKIPFREASSIVFRKRWVDKEPVTENPGGNDVMPPQVQEPEWMTQYIYDTPGYYTEPLKFYLTRGTHTIALQSIAEPVAIRKIRLFNYENEKPAPYEEVYSEYIRKGYKETSDILIKIQAERALSKSDSKIRPKSDRTSSLTEPYHPTKIKLNIIGDSSWQYNGEYIEWEVDVPEAGLYEIAFRYRQELKSSSASIRKLYINGKVPFKEMENISFPYDSDWQVKGLKDENGKPYLFYLNEGKNTIKMEVTLGEIAGILKDMEDTINSLNEIYREIIVYTGTNPDPFTDYVLDRIIPVTVDELAVQGNKLHDIVCRMKEHGTAISEDTAFIETFADQLILMSEKPYTINTTLANFKARIGSLGTWLNQFTVGPLKLDYILVMSPGMSLPRARENFFEKLLHQVKAFIGSFRENYNVIGSGNGSNEGYSDNIKIWMGSVASGSVGRDQALILKNMIESQFSQTHKIGVNIELVDAGSMLPAVLAGKAPDVAISVGSTVPVQYGLRKAVVDLGAFEGFNEIKAWFPKRALVPVSYNNKIYGMPESLTWDMLFYRKDVLYELGIDIPETWEDMINLIPVLARNNMEIGISPSMYFTFLYQQGGKIYDEQTDRCLFDSKEATKLFRDFTNLYVNYRLPVSYDMYNRFRTGEMPLVVASYNAYNTLVVFAPEIRGLWDFTVIPGTRQPDGSINRTSIGTGTYTVIFEQSRKKEAAWEFIKWWASAEAQSEYGIELEGLLGPAGRYTPANMEALKKLPWSPENLERLLEQQKWVDGIPEVPGGYYMTRNFLNAFYAVYNRGSEPREALIQYTFLVNEEIEKKRKEFGLE
ncbi:MAG: extracellular solute-binding protein [Clostridiaceae bacterium]|nr:extracellular solute-binding protein [Clostridiaceae bacterium]